MSTPTFRLAMLAAHGGRNSNLLPLGGPPSVSAYSKLGPKSRPSI